MDNDGRRRAVIRCFGAVPTLFLLTAAMAEDSPARYVVPHPLPAAHYTVDASFEDGVQRLVGSGSMQLENRSNTAIGALVFAHPDGDYRLNVSHGGTKLEMLQGSETAALYALDGPVERGQSMTLKFTFSYTGYCLPENGDVRFSRWFPRLWWDGLPAHESYRIKVDHPDGYALAVSGVQDESGWWSLENANGCGLFLGKGMSWLRKESRGVKIAVPFREDQKTGARFCLDVAVDAVDFYVDWLGFYPQGSLTFIPWDSSPHGGFSFAPTLSAIHGLEAFRDRAELHWRWITAHEVGHHYWGEYVLDGDNPSWLWIGLGVYMDRRYVDGRGYSRKKQNEMMAWYTDAVPQHYDTTLDLPPDQLKSIEYDRNSITTHGKGYSVISALEYVLGRGGFERAYRRCLKEYAGRRLGYHDFQRVCEEENEQNLEWFFRQWIRSNDYLAYDIVDKEKREDHGRHIALVTVKRRGGIDMPVPVVATFADGSTREERTTRLVEQQVLRYASDSPLLSVEIDPAGELPLIREPLP